jgi:hypothetical protein
MLMSRLVDPWSEVWVDERLGVSESPIEGSGLFFTEDVPQGTVVIRLEAASCHQPNSIG